MNKTPEFEAFKATGVLPFGAVPFWEEPDGFRLAQTDAIVRHLARTHDLYGRSAQEAARCDMIFAGVDDLRTEIRKIITVEQAKRAAVREELATRTIPHWLAYFEKLLEANGTETIVGSNLSFSDVALFHLFEMIRDNELGGTYDKCPRLAGHAARMAARPGIARHIASPARFPVQQLPR